MVVKGASLGSLIEELEVRETVARARVEELPHVATFLRDLGRQQDTR
ncbi:hypothetical protein [Streptomyces sp. HC307]